MKKFIVEARIEVEATNLTEAKKTFIIKILKNQARLCIIDYTCKECGHTKGFHGYYGPDKDTPCSQAAVY